MFEINQKVKVMRSNEDRTRWSPIKYGVVVGITNSWAQVFDPNKDTGDRRMDFSEWFAINGPTVKVVGV
jgi:hypothetical protein